MAAVFVFQPIVAAVSDPFYKITSEALLVTQQLVKVMRPLGKSRSCFEAFGANGLRSGLSRDFL